MKNKKFILVALFALLLGVTAPMASVSAHPKYVTTPKLLRGKWYYHHSNKTQYIKITKYTFHVDNYKNGKKQPGSFTASGKKLIGKISMLHLSTHVSKKGYRLIGLSESNADWNLKKVKHHGKAALKCWSYNPKNLKLKMVSYYYHK